MKSMIIKSIWFNGSRSQWRRSLSRRSSATRLLRLWVQIPPGAWMFLCCECSVLSGTGLCDGLITCPGEAYRLWRVVVCDQETLKTRRLKPANGLWKLGVVAPGKQTNKQSWFNGMLRVSNNWRKWNYNNSFHTLLHFKIWGLEL